MTNVVTYLLTYSQSRPIVNKNTDTIRLGLTYKFLDLLHSADQYPAVSLCV